VLLNTKAQKRAQRWIFGGHQTHGHTWSDRRSTGAGRVTWHGSAYRCHVGVIPHMAGCTSIQFQWGWKCWLTPLCIYMSNRRQSIHGWP